MSRRSRLGVYEGYSEEVADGYVRGSTYLAMEDGCRLAVDILRPARGGQALSAAGPSALRATGHRRAWRLAEQRYGTALEQHALREFRAGDVVTAYEARPLHRLLVHHGYNLISVDLRGTGASFGRSGFRNWRDAYDVCQVIDWIAAQPWSDGKVAMHGFAWEAFIQLCAAVYAPPALTCLVPVVPASTVNFFTGGLFLEGYAHDWSEMRKGQDRIERALPVDAGPENESESPDPDRLLEEAVAERGRGSYLSLHHVATGEAGAIHDDFTGFTREVAEAIARTGAPMPPHPELGALADHYAEVERFSRAAIPTYIIGGWWDVTFPSDYIDFFRAIEVPKRLLLGPWSHGSVAGIDAEIHRWLDYWMRGIDNGIMDEPPVHFATSDVQERVEWRGASEFPPPGIARRRLFLAPGPAPSPAHRLAREPPAQETTLDYEVDYAVSLGELSRSRHLYRDLQIVTPDLDLRAQRCLSFVTEPLAERLDLTGRVLVSLDVSASADYAAVFLTLEELTAGGAAEYVSEGYLNLAYRRESATPPAGTADSLVHELRGDSVEPVVPHERMLVRIAMFPVSHRVGAGHRLRLTLAGADAGNLAVKELDPPLVLTVRLGPCGSSFLELPLGPARSEVVSGAFSGQVLVHGVRRARPGGQPRS